MLSSVGDVHVCTSSSSVNTMSESIPNNSGNDFVTVTASIAFFGNSSSASGSNTVVTLPSTPTAVKRFLGT